MPLPVLFSTSFHSFNEMWENKYAFKKGDRMSG